MCGPRPTRSDLPPQVTQEGDVELSNRSSIGRVQQGALSCRKFRCSGGQVPSKGSSLGLGTGHQVKGANRSAAGGSIRRTSSYRLAFSSTLNGNRQASKASGDAVQFRSATRARYCLKRSSADSRGRGAPPKGSRYQLAIRNTIRKPLRQGADSKKAAMRIPQQQPAQQKRTPTRTKEEAPMAGVLPLQKQSFLRTSGTTACHIKLERGGTMLCFTSDGIQSQTLNPKP